MDSLEKVRERIRQAEIHYHRKPGSIILLASSKKQPIEKILAAYNAGQHIFGENYIQEALIKILSPELQHKDIEWHFIGKIQSNKTRKIAEHFSWVQTVASTHVAKRLNDQRPADLPPLNICLEVNISHEERKAGVAPHEALALARYCLTLPRLKLRGIMCIPKATTETAEVHKSFKQLFLIYESLRQNDIPLDTLSMGMSGDLEAAIEEGATLVRIGTAIFGVREGEH